jgi:1-acyl-sn-glycerol-3-phosphate acyltransferase
VPRASKPALSAAARATEQVRTLYGWRWFFLRTAAYCSASVAARPFTGERVPQALMQRYFEGAPRQLGIVVEAEGTEKIHPALPAILCINHNSLLDIPCVGVLFDFDYKWVSKKEIFHVPFIGWHLRACGHLHVDRKRRDNSQRLEREFHRVLQDGASILMFPEGTRSTDGRLQSLRRGAFVTAVREQVPVLPIVLDGTERLLEKHSLRFPTGPDKVVRVKVMDSIAPPPPTDGSFERRVTRLLAETRAAMVQGLDALRGQPGAAERPTIG